MHQRWVNNILSVHSESILLLCFYRKKLISSTPPPHHSPLHFFPPCPPLVLQYPSGLAIHYLCAPQTSRKDIKIPPPSNVLSHNLVAAPKIIRDKNLTQFFYFYCKNHMCFPPILFPICIAVVWTFFFPQFVGKEFKK